jgi:Tat protein secretion system quality control protein TatD with DNase activity
VNALQAGAGIIAKEAGVPVQTLLIETDSPFLSKGWPLFRRPAFPIHFRVRLGRRLEPADDVRELMAQLDRYLRAELADAPQNDWLAARPRPQVPATE